MDVALSRSPEVSLWYCSRGLDSDCQRLLTMTGFKLNSAENGSTAQDGSVATHKVMSV